MAHILFSSLNFGFYAIEMTLLFVLVNCSPFGRKCCCYCCCLTFEMSGKIYVNCKTSKRHLNWINSFVALNFFAVLTNHHLGINEFEAMNFLNFDEDDNHRHHRHRRHHHHHHSSTHKLSQKRHGCSWTSFKSGDERFVGIKRKVCIIPRACETFKPF